MSARTAAGFTMVAFVLTLVWAMTAPTSANEGVGATARRLVYASYDDEGAAVETFKMMRAAEARGAIRLEAYALVTKDLTGKVKVKDQRQAGTRAGVAVEAIVALLGGPADPTAAAASGSAAGTLTGSGVGMARETVDRVKASIRPGDAALIVGVEARWTAAVERLQEHNADQIMTHPIPDAP